MSSIINAKKFSKNGIDTPMPAPTPLNAPGSSQFTMVYTLQTVVDFAFPTLHIAVDHNSLTAGVATSLTKLIRQIRIKSSKMEDVIIEGPALQDLAAATAALITRYGQTPNLDEVLVDDGYGYGASAQDPKTSSEAYITIPAVLKPDTYTFEIQFSGDVPAGVTITNRAIDIAGVQRELPNEGLYFIPAAKHVVNTIADSQGMESKEGRFMIISNSTNGGIKGDSSNVNITFTFTGQNGVSETPNQRVIVEGVKSYARRLGNTVTQQLYMNPGEFKTVQMSRPSQFEVTIVHFYTVN